MKEYIIDDSSFHKSKKSLIEKDYSIRVGMVRELVYLNSSKETRYIVEVWRNNKLFPMTCVRTSKFGGLYNYEEYSHRGFKPGEDNVSLGNFKAVPGDMVIVAAADGESREGIILGCLNHHGRDEILPATDDQQYVSEFNGIQTIINSQGEYRRIFKGVPTNLDKLNEAPDGNLYPLPEYNIDVGFSYYEFDKTGSYTLTDNANDKLPQYIKVDKPNGKIEIVSGKTSFTIDKKAESYVIKNKITTFDSADEFSVKTKTTNIDSSKEVNIKSAKINTTGELTQKGNVKIQGNTDQAGNVKINGTLDTSGATNLAGGANPLIYEIVLIKGTGNKGAPVISQATVLKTSLTKAT